MAFEPQVSACVVEVPLGVLLLPVAAVGRAEGTEPYQFAGSTVVEYAGGGKFSYQEDVYNMKECEKVMKEWFAAGAKF